MRVYVFCVISFNQEPEETEEMAPQWFDMDRIPFDSMWTSDVYWLPYILDGKKFKGKVVFDRPSDTDYQSKILSMDIREFKEI